MISFRVDASEEFLSMLNRRIAPIAIALLSVSLVACQSKVLSPTELQAVQTASEAYLAYEREDCATVRRLTDPDALEVWEFNEKRHSMLLLQGFCREIAGDITGAREIYRELTVEAPTSFAADDAAERTRILTLIELDPDYAKWTNDARERIDTEKRKRTPIDRVPVEFPPLGAMRSSSSALHNVAIPRIRSSSNRPHPSSSMEPRYVLCVDGSTCVSLRWTAAKIDS
jgi:hypothetical protein